MAGDATALNVLLTANFKRLESDLKKAGLVAEKAVGDIEETFSKARPELNLSGLVKGGLAAGVIAGVAASVGGLIQQLAEANKQIADLDKFSSRTGLSTDRIQQIQYAGQQGGLDGNATLSGLDAVAKKIDEISKGGENGLSKLFADNNLKVTDLNSALSQTADLMRGASNAFEKEKIAEAVGLTKEWVPVLENGAAAFDNISRQAGAAGAIVDREMIQRAKEFQAAWDSAVSNFASGARQALLPILKLLQDLIGAAGKGLAVIDQKASAYAQDLIARQGPPVDPSQGLSLAQYDAAFAKVRAGGDEVADAWIKARNARADYERELNTAKARGARDLTVAPGKGTTNVDSLYSKPKPAGGGGGGISEEDQRFNQVQRYIEQLEKTGRILQAEKDSIGLTNAERAKAIELARIGTVTDEGQLASLNKQIDANEQLRQAIEKAKMAQKGMNDAAQFAGQELLGAFESLLDGGKIEDAINGITKALMKAALQAAILGQGPLANLFGGASTTGGPGGLIGSLLSAFGGARASGGPVQAGKTYMVGENGPEMVRFGKNGTVMPNSVVGGRGGGGGVNFQVINQSSAQAGQPEVSTGPDGKMMIRMMIRDEFNGDIAKNGPMAQMLQGRYGMNRSGGRR